MSPSANERSVSPEAWARLIAKPSMAAPQELVDSFARRVRAAAEAACCAAVSADVICASASAAAAVSASSAIAKPCQTRL